MVFKKMLMVGLGVIFALVALTMYLQVSASTIPTAAGAYYDLANGYNATQIGTGAASIATSSVDWLGYLWVIMPFAGAVGFIILAFKVRA